MAKSYNSIKAGWTNSDIDSTTGKPKAKKKKSYEEIKASDYDFGVNQEYIDSFVADSQKYMNDVRSNSKDVNYGNAQSRFSSFRDTSYGLSDRADTIRAYYNANKSKLDNDTYSSMMKYLDSFTKGSDEAMSFYRKNADYYSQWKTEEEYKKAKEDYKKAVEYDKKQKEMLSFDLDAGKKEIDSLDGIVSKISELENQKGKNSTTDYENALRRQGGYNKEALKKKAAEMSGEQSKKNAEIDAQINTLLKETGYATLDELKKGVAEKRSYFMQSKNLKAVNEFSTKARNSSDFGQYSKIGADIANPTFNDAEAGLAIGAWRPFADDVKNIVTYSRENAAAIALTNEEGHHAVGDFRYRSMTEDEVEVYNYYLAKEQAGQIAEGTAQSFLDSLDDILNQREALGFSEAMKGNTALELAFGVAAGLDQFASGVKNLFASGDEYIAPSMKQYISGQVREDLSNAGGEFLGKSLGQWGYDAITTTSNMLPSVAASVVVGTINPAAGSWVGAGLMGASAAGNAYADMINLGYSKGQARIYSTLTGASEALLQKALGGIPGVRGVLTDKVIEKFASGLNNAFARFAIQFAGNAYAEGMEEFLQDVLDPYIKAFATGTAPEDVDWEEAIYSGLLGALTSVAFGGAEAISNGVSQAQYNRVTNSENGATIVDNGNVQNLVDNAKGLSERGSMYSDVDTKTISKLASQIETAIKNGGEFSKSDINKIGKLYDIVYKGRQSIAVESDANTVYNHILDELQNRQDIKFKKQTARLLTNAVLDRMSATEKINFDKIGGKYILDDIFANTELRGSASADRILFEQVADLLNKNANIATRNINSDVSQYTEQPAQTANTPLSLAPSETVRENAQGFGQDISAQRVEETPTTTQDNTDRERSAEALNYALEDIDNKHISKAATDLIKAEYDGTLSAADYVAGMEEGFNFGYSQVPEDVLTDYNGPFGQLSAMQKKHSYNLGVLAREEETRKRDTGVQAKIKDAAEKSSGKNKDITFGRKIGTVKGEGVTIADLKKTFNDTQNKAYKILSTTAEITGVDIVLYKSEADEDGNFTGAQGKFKYSEDKLYIDINAGLLNEMDASELGAYAMVRTFCHEFVHFIEKWNVKGYNELRNLTFQTLQSRGINVDAEIRNTMDKLALDDYDKASREVVAETFTDVLPDSKFAQNIAEKNPGLFKKILEKLKEFLENVKSYFRSLGKNGSRVANAMKEEVNGQIRYIQNIVDVFDKVAEQAVENYQRTFAVNDTFESESAETEKRVSEPTENEKTVRELEEKTKTSLLDYEKTAGIAHKIIKASTKDRKPIRIADGDMFFVGNPSCVAVVDKETFDSFGDEILTNKSAEFTRLLDMRRQKLTGTAYSYKSENGKNLLYIKDKDGGVLLDKKYAKFFDGYDFYCDPENERVPVLFKDGNGEIVGLLAQMHKVGNINTDNLDVVNMKSFPIKEVKSNGRRNLGIQGQEGSFDARLWDILDRKQHFINQIMNGDNVGRTAEDTGDVTLSAAEVKALASGNPLIMEQVQLSNELQKLEDLQRAHKSSVLTAQTKSLEDKQRILQAQKTIENITADIKARVDTYTDGKFSMTVDKKTFTDKKEAGVSLLAEITTKALTDKYVSVGKFAGFDLFAMKDGVEYSGIIKGQSSYKFNVYMSNTTQMINKICSVVSDLDERLNAWKERLSELKTDLAAQEKMAVEPFAKQEELDKKRARFNEVMEILNPPEEQQIADDEDEQYQSRKLLEDDKENFSTIGVHWGISDGILTKTDARAVWEAIENIQNRGFRGYPKTVTGEYYIESGNKLMIVDTNFRHPRVETIFVFNDDSETNMSEAKELLIDAQGIYERLQNAWDIIRDVQGEEYISRYDCEDSPSYEREKPGRERSNSGEDIDGEIQYQQRTDTLTDRRVLELAAEDVRIDDLTQGEVYALDVFKKRLETIRDLQAQRKEQGQLYKEQQFGSKTDKAEAVKTLNRMKILDDQIKKASAELLSVEEKEVLKRVLQRARKVIEAKDREETKEILRRQSERRKESEAVRKYRQRIKLDVSDISSWITNPNNKTSVNRVPDVLKNSVIPFLTSIDFTSKRQLRGGAATRADREFANRLEKLQGALKTNGEVNGLYSGYNDLPPDFTERLQSFVNAVHTLTQGENDGYVINRMTGEELKELSKIVRTLKKFITEMNIFHYNAVFSHVTDAAESTITELRSIKNAGIAQNGVTNWGFWQNMRPAYAFERFGEGGKAIYDEFRRAQATLAFNAKEIIEFAENTYTRAEVKAWEKEYKEFNLDGDTVRVPVSYIMSLYKLYDDPDGRRHILGEGARVAAHKEGVIRKEQDSGHKLSEEDVKQIIGTLTDRQKAVADALQEFMATQGAAWGNYVSVKRFGEEIFTNPKYFPISSDGRYIEAAAAEHPNEASLYALLNMSFTKKRNENANNRIVIFSIFDVFANHMASMAQYNAFALPVLDALKWYNYKQVSVDEETGAKTVTGSVRDEMARAYGVAVEKGKPIKGYAEKFVENIIKAYNGTEAQGSVNDSLGLKSLRLYNVAQIAYNLRVVVQQPLAITRAGLIIDVSSILKGMKASPKTVKANIEEMYKYSGIAYWKSLGFYDINISRGLTDIIKHNNTVYDRIIEFGMSGAEKADEITWSAMWNACKEEVRKKQPYIQPGSAEFFSAVNKVFENVIYKTQVVDSVLTKSEFMRSKGFFARTVSSFMSEPVTTASMLMSAYERFRADRRRGISFSNAWRRNRKNIVRTAAAYGIGALLLAAVQAVMDALRDDDDDKNYGEKYLDALIGNFIDEIVPFNKLPIISDVYDIAKSVLSKVGFDTYGNPPQSVFAQWYDSLIKGVEIIYDKITGENTGYEWYAGIAKLLQAVSGMTGLPLAAATREVITAWNNTVGVINSDLKVRKYEGSENNVNAERFVKSMDKDFYSEWLEDEKDRIRKDREEQGKTDYSDEQLEAEAKKKVKSAISGVLKKSYIEAFNDGDDEAMSKIQKQMLDMDIYGTEDEIAKLCRKWIEDYDPSSNKALKSGINEAIEQGDFKTVSSLVNELRDAGMSDTSIKSAITSYWKPIYIEAYENNDEATKAKIRKGLYYTGLWKAQKKKPLSDVINEKCNDWVKEYKQNQ